MGHTSQALPQRVLVEMIGIEPIVTEVGGVTVPCHTIAAASPLEMPDISKLAPQTRVERVTNRLTVCYSTD